MPSVIEICNRAITEIGGYPIQALTDQSKEAQTCSLIYAPARDETLRGHEWNFSTRRVVLALLTDTYIGWTYAYQYPTDCLRARQIYDATEASESAYLMTESELLERAQSSKYKVEFEVAAGDDLVSKVILTNAEDAQLFYTARVTDPNMFDVLFVRALVYRLAADLVAPMKGDPRMAKQMEEKYFRALMEAEAENSNEQQQDPDNSNTFVSART